MEIKTMTKENLDQARKMYMYCFSVPAEKISDWVTDDFKFENYIGYFDNDTLASCMGILPYEIFYNDSIVKMGGISGVATLPEYRHNHCASTLLIKTLEIMKKNGQIFSMLAPFSYEFYRKYGWELGFRSLQYELPISDFKRFGKFKKVFKQLDINDIQKMDKVYTTYISKYNGAVKRTDDLWKDKLKLKGTNYAYGIFNRTNDLIGYIFYEISDSKFVVQEMVYIDFATKLELLRFIYSHSAQVEKVLMNLPVDDNLIDLLENPRKNISLKSGMMVRVIDVKKALELYKYNEEGNFTISVNDPYCDWNNKIFNVHVSTHSKNNTVQEISSIEPDIKCSIQTFSQIILGICSIEEPLSINKIDIVDSKIDIALKMFSKKSTFLNDHF